VRACFSREGVGKELGQRIGRVSTQEMKTAVSLILRGDVQNENAA